ncbi:hypothetical protein GBAR_LOCUS26959 [Geodia barretti]|uniref:Uncharacterized protein n=1 Tax=Geodia barretti TaxID=519541 RepID=A0AA35XE10_GEOBA|nr:hypothetical protein GBAR_LOCUS26959 [Geodia barretti]
MITMCGSISSSTKTGSISSSTKTGYFGDSKSGKPRSRSRAEDKSRLFALTMEVSIV